MITPPTPYPEPFVSFPTATHTSTLILLHGTSQDGPGFGAAFLSSPIPMLIPQQSSTLTKTQTQTLPQLFPGTRFVFPSGRLRYCTVLDRQSHAWFDFLSFSDRTLGEEGQVGGLIESTSYLRELVRSEVALLEEGNVVLGGFSQGAAMAAVAVLSGELGRGSENGICGLVGLSGWLPFRRQILDAIKSTGSSVTSDKKVVAKAAMTSLRDLLGLRPLDEGNGKEDVAEEEAVERLLSVKAWLGHGEDDVKMKPEWGIDTAGLMEQIGMDVEFKGYEGLAHWWSAEEMVDLVVILKELWSLRDQSNSLC